MNELSVSVEGTKDLYDFLERQKAASYKINPL